MFKKRKQKKQIEKNKSKQEHLQDVVFELYKTCWELGCSNCQYNNYDKQGHCKISAFDRFNIEYRPIDWGWIIDELTL